MNLLPLLILFVLPMLSSLLATGPEPGPDIRTSPEPPYTLQRTSKPRGLQTYYVDPDQVTEFKDKNFHDLDRQVEITYIKTLQYECENEKDNQNRKILEARGFLFDDTEKIKKAKKIVKKSCDKLHSFGLQERNYY
jgi:DnaJ homolog subfamily B member 12